MKVLLSWLREFAPLSQTVEQIGDALGALGTPVEEMTRVGEGLGGVVVAKVLDVRAIEGADYIQLVDVDAGTGEALEIVCGARNMAVGDLVPLATVGATLPNGMEIARRKMRGHWSNGMLCAPDELQLGARTDGIMILDVDATPGTDFASALGIEPDVLYDLEVNPNRPDAMSVVGIARDLAAWFKVPFSIPPAAVAEDATTPVGDLASVVIEAPELCGRFVSRVLRNITIGRSHPKVALRLTLAGMRPINNVVDASNYVMLERGRPSHPYDLARLAGGAIRVRRARDGETMVTLDDVERKFTAEDLLICDGTGTPIGIAGLMGGASTEISPSTTDVLLEMAWFDPMGIARMSRRLQLRSEASARFEKGCDPYDIDESAVRFAELLGAGTPNGPVLVAGAIDARGELPDRTPVRVRTERVNRILGTVLTRDDIAGYLAPIGFASAPAGGDDLDVTIPSFRYDSATEVDVTEEVGRHHGYANIVRTVPRGVRRGGLTERQQDRRAVRAALVGIGLSEALPTPFLAPGDIVRAGLTDEGITITNPLVAEESVLRTSLRPGLLKTIAYNESHRNFGAQLFEIGHIFLRGDDESSLPDERESVAAALAGAEAPASLDAWQAVVDALAPNGAQIVAASPPGLHPARSAEIRLDGRVVGVLGEIDSDVLETYGITERVAWFEADLGQLLDCPHGDRPYRRVSRYPSSDIDLAFEVDGGVPAAAVAAAIRSAAGDLLVGLSLFDVYRGPGIAPGARSLAFTLRFQAADRTLTDAEVGEARAAAIAAVERELPAKLRA